MMEQAVYHSLFLKKNKWMTTNQRKKKHYKVRNARVYWISIWSGELLTIYEFRLNVRLEL